MKLLIILLVALPLIAAAYLAYVLLSSWTEVKGAPREDMYFCPKHGFILAKNVITFGEPMDVATGRLDAKGKEVIERKVVQYCPLCFHSNLKAAENVQ